MKRSISILKFLGALIMSIVFGTIFGAALGVSAFICAGVLMAFSFVPLPSMGGIAMAGVLQEVWTGAVKEELNEKTKGTFLDGIEDFSKHVANVGDEMQVIHLVYMGATPDVLINNTTYPIPLQVLDQEDIPISLDKYQTKVTPVTDDELYALSYEKISLVKSKHARAIASSKIQKALHSLAPAGNTADMPVLVTTGADDGAGRKKLIKADLLKLKRACDKLEIPAEGRRLVLCSDHENDISDWDEKFTDQFYNRATGKPYNLLGFELFSYVASPYYNPTTKVKIAFGAVPEATDQMASVFFSLARSAKAEGWTKMYYSDAKTDPENQQNKVNFRHHYIVLPTREDSRGAIISDNV